MNLELLRNKLLSAARADVPSDRVPLAFEKRILAHLKNSPATDFLALWARALWRAAVPCIIVAILISAWSANTLENTSTNAALISSNNSVSEIEDLSQHFERVMLAGVGEPTEEFQ